MAPAGAADSLRGHLDVHRHVEPDAARQHASVWLAYERKIDAGSRELPGRRCHCHLAPAEGAGPAAVRRPREVHRWAGDPPAIPCGPPGRRRLGHVRPQDLAHRLEVRRRKALGRHGHRHGRTRRRRRTGGERGDTEQGREAFVSHRIQGALLDCTTRRPGPTPACVALLRLRGRRRARVRVPGERASPLVEQRHATREWARASPVGLGANGPPNDAPASSGAWTFPSAKLSWSRTEAPDLRGGLRRRSRRAAHGPTAGSGDRRAR